VFAAGTVDWAEFTSRASALAARAVSLLDERGVLLIGTIRSDGSPRISPVEPLFHEGELMLGMMWKSLKALDLRRDPRCTIHSAVADRTASAGEFKAHGAAIEINEPSVRASYGHALEAKIGFRPEGERWHLFAVRVASAALFETGDTSRTVARWLVDRGVETFEQGP